MGLFSVNVPEPDYGELWQTYQTWQAEDEQRYKQSKSQATARMAASGMKRNTDQWRNTLAQFDADYEKQQQSLQKGATYQQLEAHWQGSTAKLWTAEAERLGYQGTVNNTEDASNNPALRAGNAEYLEGAKQYVQNKNPGFAESVTMEQFYETNYNKDAGVQQSVATATQPTAAEAAQTKATQAAGGGRVRGGGGGPQTNTGSWLEDEDEQRGWLLGVK